MNGKAAIVEELMLRLGLSRRQAWQLVDAIFGELRERLAAGERVAIPRFGTFSVSERAARAGRNPATGQHIRIEAQRSARFRPAPELRERVDPPVKKSKASRPRPKRPRPSLEAVAEPPPGPRREEASGAEDLSAAPPEGAAGRRIVATLEGRPAGRPIPLDEATVVVFRVGRPDADDLAEGADRDIADGAVPPGGLDTEWTVLSRGTELVALSAETRVESREDDGETVWTARFDLHLPERGESDRRRLGVLPRRAGEARLTVVLAARRSDDAGRELREVFRSAVVRLVAGRGDRARRQPVAVEGDHERVAAAHTNPGTTHEWTTPPGRLTLVRIDDRDALVDGVVRDGDAWRRLHMVREAWPVAEAQVRGPIDNARGALDALRQAHTGYLDAVDPDDVADRLARWSPPSEVDWDGLADGADAAHREAWRQVAASGELFDLAVEGFALYRAFFPDGSPLRAWLDAQPRGFRLDVVWRPGTGAWLPDVPWSLMHRRPPRRGQAVDPLDFLGLGFRLGQEIHPVSGNRTLGSPGESRRANLLYWHDDETGAEARRQRERWRALGDQLFAPADPGDPDRMEQVLRMLEAPAPAPVGVLYVFCQADAAQPNRPRLRFGGNWAADSGVTHTGLGRDALANEPLVFVNACDTAAGSAVYANALLETFANRRARGYLGSLTRVPIRFAERFATVFFHLFERRFDPLPLAAGEAVALTRLFFWLEYRNLGGLFYSYVDQYDLYRASEAEVQALRTG